MNPTELWKKGVVYQIYPRSFCDSNGDGIGDIQGIISKLDHLVFLGVDMIWLSPVYKSPNDDNGYDISDYFSINEEYGTMEDMELLIQKANEKGLKIIMDLVINHTSDEHQWFIESKNKNQEYRDYYIWKDKPNNWTSFFSGPAWSKIDDQYYLHLFSKKQPDLNWKNPRIMEEIKRIIFYWMDKGIYGFRCDVINIIYKTSLENGRKRLVLTGREFYHSQEGCHEILRTLRRDVFSKYDSFTVGETVMVNTKQANELVHPKREELDAVFGFEHMEVDQINNKWFKTKFKPNKLIKVLTKWQKEVYWNANYFENHDQPRSVSRFGNEKKYHEESAKMIATLLLTLKGTPFIFQGQEIGMTNADFESLDEYKDLETHRIYDLATKLHFPKWYKNKMIKLTSRDNARTPMQWNKDGGFSKANSWLKMNRNFNEINVENQKNESFSILNHYKMLISLRKNNEILIDGLFKPLYQKQGVFIFLRKKENRAFITILNLTKNYKKMPVKINGKILISNYKEHRDIFNFLRPYEAYIVEYIEAKL
jgi:oligo-1,6-glucosidase